METDNRGYDRDAGARGARGGDNRPRNGLYSDSLVQQSQSGGQRGRGYGRGRGRGGPGR